MRVVAPIDAMLFAEAEPDRQFDDKTGFTQIKRQPAGNKGEKLGIDGDAAWARAGALDIQRFTIRLRIPCVLSWEL